MLYALPHRHIVDGDALIDTAGSCVVTRASKRPPATSNLSISYLAAGPVGPMRAEAAALRIGRHHGVCDVRVYDVGRDNRLIATVTVTINFLDGSNFAQMSA